MNKIVFTDNNAIAFSNNGRILFGCAPKCDLCVNSPASWSVEISGVTTGVHCENCEEANGTFIVDEAFETEGSPVRYCQWHYMKVWGPCPKDDLTDGYFRKLRVWVGLHPTTGYGFGVSWIFEDLGRFQLGWYKCFGATKPDCAAFDDLDVPLSWSSDCLASTSTCRVTAL